MFDGDHHIEHIDYGVAKSFLGTVSVTQGFAEPNRMRFENDNIDHTQHSVTSSGSSTAI